MRLISLMTTGILLRTLLKNLKIILAFFKSIKNVQVAEKFSFSTINEHDIDTVILKLNTHKATTTGNIPPKVMVENHKHDYTTNKSNYRPVSNLPTVSKVFERILNEQGVYEQVLISLSMRLS